MDRTGNRLKKVLPVACSDSFNTTTMYMLFMKKVSTSYTIQLAVDCSFQFSEMKLTLEKH